MADIKHLVWHCSDTPASFDVTKHHIEDWHIRERNWTRVGYHVLVRRNGSTDFMIPFDRDSKISNEELANGARGFNHNSIHFCWAGGKNNDDNRTSEQKATMEAITEMMVMLFPKIKVLGHNQINAHKYCPSFNLTDWLRSIDIHERNIDTTNYENNPTYKSVG
jgi:N-acetylmuramoyl-L-alanine amidase